jgi:hypothetical protein
MSAETKSFIQLERIRLEVRKKFFDYRERCHLLGLDEEQVQHVVNIGTSILCTKWKIGPDGGSFVHSVVDNDLMGAFSRADEVNTRAIHFYTMLIYNTGYIE